MFFHEVGSDIESNIFAPKACSFARKASTLRSYPSWFFPQRLTNSRSVCKEKQPKNSSASFPFLFILSRDISIDCDWDISFLEFLDMGFKRFIQTI